MKGYTRREILIILMLSLSVFTGILNLYLLTPFLKLVAGEFHVSQSAAGQLSTSYAVVAGLIGLVGAPLMDRYQRGRILQAGLLIVAIGTILSAIAWSFPALLLARATAGFGAAVTASCNMAAASDAFPDLEKRNRCVGILIAASGVAAIIGIPLLTRIESLASWRWAAASLLLPLALLEVGVMTLPKRQLTADPSFLADYLARYRRVLSHRETTYLLLASFVRNVIWTAPIIYSVAIWVDGFHMSLRGYSWIFFLGGSTIFVGSNLAPQVIRRASARTVFVTAIALQLASALAFGLSQGRLGLALLLYCGIFCFAGSFAVVSLNILLQDTLPADRGAVLSLSATTQQAGSALGAVVGGAILAGLSAEVLLPVIALLSPIIFVAVWMSRRERVIVPAEVLDPAV